MDLLQLLTFQENESLHTIVVSNFTNLSRTLSNEFFFKALVGTGDFTSSIIDGNY